MNLKTFILRFSLLFRLVVLLLEVSIRVWRGLPPVESERSQFKYQYEEIYKRFFKKIKLPDGSIVYKSQRSYGSDESFPIHKPKDTERIFVLGGSVSTGVCYYDNKHIMKKLLEESISNNKFEIIGCGMGAYDSYRVSLVHKEIMNYDPDFIVLLSGNNEYYDPIRLNLWIYRLNRLLRNLWIYRFLQDRVLIWGRHYGMYKISPDRRLRDYERTLRIMIRRSQKKRVPIILCTLPVNFRDCAPMEIPNWKDKEFFLAWYSLNKGRFKEALRKFSQYIATYPNDAFGYYFLAKCYDALEDYPQAQRYYLKALALDIDPGNRCPPQRNAVIRHLCIQEGAILVDLERYFIKNAPQGLLGKEFFADECHWWDEYYSLVCQLIAQSIVKYYKSNLDPTLSPSIEDKQNGRIKKISSVDIATTNIDVIRNRALKIISAAFSDISLWNFKIGLMNERIISFIESAYKLSPELFDNYNLLKEYVLNKITSNWWMRAKLLHFDSLWLSFICHISEALYRLKESIKAIEYINLVIKKDPDSCLPYLIRGLAYYDIGQFSKARQDFERISQDASCRHPLVDFYKECLKNLNLTHL